MNKIRQFPHCDQRILHAPGECVHCDTHPIWQELREAWGIAFTGKTPKVEQFRNELPCPADFNRGDSHKNWGGNTARPATENIQQTRADIPPMYPASDFSDAISYAFVDFGKLNDRGGIQCQHRISGTVHGLGINESYQCTLNANHRGMHSAMGMLWTVDQGRGT